jgi:phage anti-repressor protein
MNHPIITITTQVIGTEETDAVNARELYKALEVRKDFSDWIKAQIRGLGLEENVDYISFPQKVEREIGATIRTEYILTLDAAKHIAMASRSAKGKEVRAYFIEVEKRWRSQHRAAAPAAAAGLERSLEILGRNLEVLATVVAQMGEQMRRLDRRLSEYEAIERYRREAARRRRKTALSPTVAAAWEGRRAAFVRRIVEILSSSDGSRINKTELLRRAGYRKDDKTAREWLRGGVGIYWRELSDRGHNYRYELIEEPQASA